MIISRKRLEEMIAGRMEQKERERMLYQRMEDVENNCNKRIRELYGELSDMRCRLKHVLPCLHPTAYVIASNFSAHRKEAACSKAEV